MPRTEPDRSRLSATPEAAGSRRPREYCRRLSTRSFGRRAQRKESWSFDRDIQLLAGTDNAALGKVLCNPLDLRARPNGRACYRLGCIAENIGEFGAASTKADSADIGDVMRGSGDICLRGSQTGQGCVQRHSETPLEGKD